jgi:hypothetical protein
MNDIELQDNLRDFYGSITPSDSARASRLVDTAIKAERARHATREPSQRPWALAGIAAAMIVAIVAGVGFVALTNQPVTGPAAASPSASAAPTIGPATTGVFVPTASMRTIPQYVTTTTLASGLVLVTESGGNAGTTPVAELFDPKTGTFAPTGSMNVARTSYTATLLADGRVLIAGGSTVQELASAAELYDPSTGRFSLTGSMHVDRIWNTATLLADGRVLFAGGTTSSGSAELYDPRTGTFSTTGTMNDPRFEGDTATLLADGRVLIAGGRDVVTFGTGTEKAEIYDPATGKFTATGSMAHSRSYHSSTLLQDGRVLVAGGNDPAELYDPKTGTFSPTGAMVTPRTRHTATLLADGRVLFAGGMEFSSLQTPLAAAELYDPSTGAFTATGSLQVACQEPGATLLLDGRVLITDGSATASLELYVP